MNVGPYCPVDPVTNMNWMEYLTATSVELIEKLEVDGLFYDNVNDSPYYDGGLVDANADNIPDGGEGPSGHGWIEGEWFAYYF